MQNSSRTRQPFREVQNLGKEARLPRTTQKPKSAISIKKKTISKPPTAKLNAEKKSGLPPPSTRTQMTSARSIRSTSQSAVEDKPAVPPRLQAKPKRSVGPRNVAGSGAALLRSAQEGGRRSMAALSFTQSKNSRAGGLGRRQDAASPPRSVDEGAASAFIEKLHSSNDQFIETLCSKIQSSQQDREDKFFKLGEERLEIKGVLLETQAKLTQTEALLKQEKACSQSLEEQLSQLNETIASLEDREGGRNLASKEEVDDLKEKLEASEERWKVLAEEKHALETNLCEKQSALSSLELEVERSSTKLKEALRRIESTEIELDSRVSEIRRLNREKETTLAEKQKTEELMKEKNISVLEERKKTEALQDKVAELEKKSETIRAEAENKLHTFAIEVGAKLEALEKERDALRSSESTVKADLDLRTQEIDHLKQAVSLQESKISTMSCAKMEQDLKIESLHVDASKANQQIAELKKTIESQSNELVELEKQAREDAAMRRKLHNEVQELKGNIRVFCRVRPLLKHELEKDGAELASNMFQYNEKGQGIIANSYGKDEKSMNRYPFRFDKVFDAQSTQDAVFEEISQLVQSALDGYRVCIFAYGQTGSGKTHTMLGDNGGQGANLGMIPRSVRQIFDSARVLEKDGWRFSLRASFLEIYNETVRDLLVDSSTVSKQKVKDDYKIIYNHESKLSEVHGLTVETVENGEQVQRLINKSMKNRATAATKANERSSRSHSVFRLYIDGENMRTGQIVSGLLNLIDLAGSERLAQSKAEGDRLRETRHINKSLSALGTVITSLANSEKHIPYRNSKLTYLLQDSLGGDSKALMFVNVSHALESFNESLCSLRFAAKVNSCHVGTAKRTSKIEL